MRDILELIIVRAPKDLVNNSSGLRDAGVTRTPREAEVLDVPFWILIRSTRRLG